MCEENLDKMLDIISEDGASAALTEFITALKISADTHSDMGLKRQAIEEANMADRLIQIQKGCSII